MHSTYLGVLQHARHVAVHEVQQLVNHPRLVVLHPLYSREIVSSRDRAPPFTLPQARARAAACHVCSPVAATMTSADVNDECCPSLTTCIFQELTMLSSSCRMRVASSGSLPPPDMPAPLRRTVPALTAATMRFSQ